MSNWFEQRYNVHNILCQSPAITSMLAKKINTGLLYTVNIITEKSLVIQYLDDFLSLQADEFTECFTDEGKLYVVFTHPPKESIGRDITSFLESGGMDFEQKVEFAKKLTLGLTRYASLPYVVQMALLMPENIYIKDNELRFGFNLAYLRLDPEFIPTAHDVFNRLGTLLENVFTASQKSPGIMPDMRSKIDIVVQKCRKKIYNHFHEVYKDLCDIKSLAEDVEQRKQSTANKVHTLRTRILPVVGIVIVISGIIVSLYFLVFSQTAKPVFLDTETIGTRDIIEYILPSDGFELGQSDSVTIDNFDE